MDNNSNKYIYSEFNKSDEDELYPLRFLHKSQLEQLKKVLYNIIQETNDDHLGQN